MKEPAFEKEPRVWLLLSFCFIGLFAIWLIVQYHSNSTASVSSRRAAETV